MASAPPLSFETFQITATSTIPISNHAGSVEQPESQFLVWIRADPDSFIDGPTGSKKPIGLCLPSVAVSRLNLNLEVEGVCIFPVDWPRGPQTCQLRGTLRGDAQPASVILSEPWDVDLMDSNPKVPIPSDMGGVGGALKAFTITAPFQNDRCPIPFRIAGDFEWECVNTKNNQAQPIKLDKMVRLEINWMLGPAVSGEDHYKGSFLKSGVNLNGVYPVNLLRLFLPHPKDFAAENEFPKHYLQWWMRNCLGNIPSSKFVYDTIVGKSGFGVGCCGGSFGFDDFCQVAFSTDTAAKPTLLNSFDLAALVQLACTLLVSDDGDELLNSKWVCKTPSGPQKAGLPFGASDKTVPPVTWPQGCNNPFFNGIDGALAFESDAAKIRPANARAWIEVKPTSSDPTTVVDWSFAVLQTGGTGPQFENASRDRKTFAQSHMDVSTPNLNNYLEGHGRSSGQCFCNDDFGSGQAGLDEGKARVGLYNLRGLNKPRPGHSAPHVPVPPGLRLCIEKLIASGKNTTTQRWRYNDASLKAMNVAPIVIAGTTLTYVMPQFKDRFYTSLQVVSGAVSASYSFSNFAVKPTETGSLSLKIMVFNDFFEAYEAMVFNLTTYERNVDMDQAEPTDRIVKPPTGGIFLGHYSLQTPRSVIWVRGNLFVEFTVQSPSKADSAAITQLVAAAQRLDTYLARHTVMRSQMRRPHLHFVAGKTPPTTAIKGNTSFEVQLDAGDVILERFMSVQFNRPYLLVHGRFDATDSTHKFWALRRDGPDEKDDRTIRISIAGAHVDTFQPGQMDFEITVAGLLSKKSRQRDG